MYTSYTYQQSMGECLHAEFGLSCDGILPPEQHSMGRDLKGSGPRDQSSILHRTFRRTQAISAKKK